MKLNKKGFMMAEVIVVSAIILTFLAGIFISYNKIYSAYKTRLDYYDVTALYRLRFYKDYYIEFEQECPGHGNKSVYECKLIQAMLNGKSESVEQLANINPEYENVKEKVFIFYNNYKNLASDLLKDENVNLTYKDYVNYLANSVDLKDANYVMTIERCDNDDVDRCKYAYLEVYDEVTIE